MFKHSQEYLDKVRAIFEKRYKRKLTDEEVEIIANRLMNFGTVIENFFKKKKTAYGDKYDLWYKDFIESAKVPK